jgi:hypothetical protein
VDPILVREESVRHPGLEDACLNEQLDGVIVAPDGATELAGCRAELKKQAERISSGALIPVDDHDPVLTDAPAGGGAKYGARVGASAAAG